MFVSQLGFKAWSVIEVDIETVVSAFVINAIYNLGVTLWKERSNQEASAKRPLLKLKFYQFLSSLFLIDLGDFSSHLLNVQQMLAT